MRVPGCQLKRICYRKPETRNPQLAPKRRRGAPKGNRNATRHGFYSRKNRENNIDWLRANTDLGRADCEIFLAVLQTREIARRFPADVAMYKRSFKRFMKLVKRRYGITSDRQVDRLNFALDQVEKDFNFSPERLAEIGRHIV